MARAHEPLCAWTARGHWLRAVTAAALGAEPPQRMRNDVFAVATVLFDRRIAAVGGREGMPYSCASVYASFVARFRGGIAGQVIHRAPLHLGIEELMFLSNMHNVQLDFTRDLRSVVALCPHFGGHFLKVFDAATGVLRHSTEDVYDEEGQCALMDETDMFVAEDGFIFASCLNDHRVHVFSPLPDATLHVYVGGYDEDDHKDYIWNANTVCATTEFVLAGSRDCLYRFSRRNVRAPHVTMDVEYDVLCMRPLHDDKRVAFLTSFGIGIVCAADLRAPGRFFAFEADLCGRSLHLACSAYDEFIVLASTHKFKADAIVYAADGTVCKTTTLELPSACCPWAAACSRTTVALALGGTIVFWG